MTITDNNDANNLVHGPFTKSPITFRDEVKVRTGNNANGNCKLIKALSKSFIVVRSDMLWNAIKTVGMIAIVRVKRTRFHLHQCKLRKPSIANCPE